MTVDPNPLVTFLENYLLMPNSDFYLSKILYDPNGKSLDYFSTNEINLGVFFVEGVTLDVTIKNLLIKGLSNTQVIISGNTPDITVVGNQVTFHAKLPNTQQGYIRPLGVPDKIEMQGEIDVSIAGTPMPPGTILVTVNTIENITGVFTADEQEANDLSTAQVTFTQISVEMEEASSNINIEVNIESGFASTINQLLNTPKAYSTIIAQLNVELAKSDTLAKLSAVATNCARAALKNSTDYERKVN